MPSVRPAVQAERDPVHRLDQAVVGREVTSGRVPRAGRLRPSSRRRRRPSRCLTLGSTTAYRMSTTRLAITMKNAASSVTPRISGRSWLSIAWMVNRPRPCSENVYSVMIAPPSSSAQVHAEDRDDRGQRGAQPVLDDHGPLGQALGPRGTDVVLAHRLQHARPGQPGVQGRVQEGQADPGQHQVPRPQERVLGERHVRHVGEDRPLVAEQLQRDQAGEEDRQRHAGQRDAHREPVEEGAALAAPRCTPIATPPTSQMTAAPMASESVTGMSLTICGQTGCWVLKE